MTMPIAPLLLMMACASPQLTESASVPDQVTWTDVAPIFEASCTRCHSDRGTASDRPFQRYQTTAPYGTLIVEKTASGQMPPFGPQVTDWCPTDFHWQSDVRLSEDAIHLLSEWVADGTPEGAEVAEPLQVPAESPPLAGVNMELSAPTWTSDPAIADQTICFILDPELTEVGWLEGVNVRPGNLNVVHHAGIRLDYTGGAEELAGEDGWYDCTNALGTPMAYLGTYAPGSGASVIPNGAATLIPQDSKLVLSVHYHNVGDTPLVDQTTLELRWADGQPERLAALLHWPNPPELPLLAILQPGENDPDGVAQLFVPAGESAHIETLRVDGPGTPDEWFELYQIASHMHLAGRSSRIWAEHPDGTVQCLGDFPNWDFENQQMFRYEADALPLVPGGSTFWMECVYDNTLGNEQLAQSLAERGLTEPEDVAFGSGSNDEMCMFMLGMMKVADP